MLEIQKIGNRYLSLDTPVQADDSSVLIDLLHDENQEMPDSKLIEMSMQEGSIKFLILLMKEKKGFSSCISV